MLVSGVAAVRPGRGRDGVPSLVPRVPIRFRDAGRESFPAGIWRRGGDGEAVGDGEAGPGGRERGPGGRGAGGGARRPGGAVRGAGGVGGGRGPVLRSRGAGEGDRGRGAGAAAAAAAGRVRHRWRPGGAGAGVASAAGIPHGSVEEGHGRGVASVFGPVRVTRMAYRNRREPNLYPADARQVLPGDPYSLGMRALAAFHLAGGGFGQAQEVIEARTGVTVGRAQLTGLAEDLAAWTGDFYEERSRDAEEDEQPDSDVIMMQGDGKGIAMRPEHRRNAGKEDGTRPGIKKMAEIVAVADFTPAVREPEDIAAPPARRQAHPGPKARDKWVSASVTESIEDMIAAAFDEADRRDPQRTRQRVFLVDGNKQQITAIEAQADERGLKVPVLIDYIHVSGYLGKAAAALHPGDPRRRRPVGRRAAAARPARPREGRRRHPRLRRRENPRQRPHPPPRPHRHGQGRHLPDQQPQAHEIRQGPRQRLAHRHRHDRGRLQVRHRGQIRDYRRQMVPDGAETILKLRAVVVNGDLDDYMNYYKERYRAEHHLARYDEDTIDRLNLAA